jgi:polar amino acid transport system permease protein
LPGLLSLPILAAVYPFKLDAFLHYLLEPTPMVVTGIWLTIGLAIVSEALGVVIGVAVALARTSRVRPIRWFAKTYIWYFRGTPLLVQIALVYFAGFPFFGLPIFLGYMWNDIDILGFVIAGRILAGIFALSVNEGAYMAEIVRAGINSVDPGQLEASRSLGMTYRLAMRRIILPQAIRFIVPPLGNQFNTMLKTTSLLSIISVVELYTASNILQGQKFQPFEVFLAASVYYLIMTSIWSLIQGRLEAWASKGVGGSGGAGGERVGFAERLFRGRNARPAAVIGAGSTGR